MKKVPLTCNASELRRLRRWKRFPAYPDLVSDLARLPGLVAFLGREGVPGRFLDPFALAVTSLGQEIVEEVADGLAACLGEARLGEGGRVAGVVAGDAEGHGEGDPV